MRRGRVSPTGFWSEILAEDFRKHGRRRNATEIAASVGVSDRTFRNYMKSLPPLDIAVCLCKYLGITLEQAIGEVDCDGEEKA